MEFHKEVNATEALQRFKDGTIIFEGQILHAEPARFNRKGPPKPRAIESFSPSRLQRPDVVDRKSFLEAEASATLARFGTSNDITIWIIPPLDYHSILEALSELPGFVAAKARQSVLHAHVKSN